MLAWMSVAQLDKSLLEQEGEGDVVATWTRACVSWSASVALRPRISAWSGASVRAQSGDARHEREVDGNAPDIRAAQPARP
jgi:hypothetical protein